MAVEANTMQRALVVPCRCFRRLRKGVHGAKLSGFVGTVQPLRSSQAIFVSISRPLEVCNASKCKNFHHSLAGLVQRIFPTQTGVVRAGKDTPPFAEYKEFASTQLFRVWIQGMHL